MRLKKILLVCFLYVIGNNLFAQEEIKIELQDKTSAEPVSFATVRFEGTNRGLVADYNGQFRLPLKLVEELNIIVITSIGYEALEVDPKKLSLDKINILLMAPQTEVLDAVILKSKKPKFSIDEVKKNKQFLATDIVKKAVNAIPLNLDDKPHSYIGYYRDYQIIDDQYYNLNEGILEQFDYGIDSEKIQHYKNQSVLYSFKTNVNFNIDEYYTKAYNEDTKYIQNADILSYGGNELTLLNVHDAIRNYNINTFSYVNIITKDFLHNHRFSKGSVRFIDGEPVVDINLESIKSKVSYAHNASGVITISLNDFSIYNFVYTVYDFNRLNPLFNIETEYRRQNGTMYLNYITFNNRFVVVDNDIFKESGVTYNREQNRFYVSFDTDIDVNTVQRRDFKIRFNDRKIFIEKLEVLGTKQISLQVAEFDESLMDVTYEEMEGFDFVIKNISDLKGRKINDPQKKTAYQFREFFIQEVIQEKDIDKNLKVIPKKSPLSLAPINEISEMDTYILNTPLMQRRMKKD